MPACNKLEGGTTSSTTVTTASYTFTSGHFYTLSISTQNLTPSVSSVTGGPSWSCPLGFVGPGGGEYVYYAIGDGSTSTVTFHPNGAAIRWSLVETSNGTATASLGQTADSYYGTGPATISSLTSGSSILSFLTEIGSDQSPYTWSGTASWFTIESASSYSIGFSPAEVGGSDTPTVGSLSYTAVYTVFEIKWTGGGGGSPTGASCSPTTLTAGSTGNAVHFWLTPLGTDGWTIGTPGSPTIGISSTGSGESITAQSIIWQGEILGGDGEFLRVAELTIDAGTNAIITLTDPDSGETATITVGTGGGSGVDSKWLQNSSAGGAMVAPPADYLPM